MLKIDVFNHIFPKSFFERMAATVEDKGKIKRWLNIPFLHDVETRFRMLEEFGDDYRQILSLSAPPIEIMGSADETPDLARLANDGMAELVDQYPGRFPGFIASLPMNNVEASLGEMDRSVSELGAVGVQIFTNVNGRPLDRPEFKPLFDRMAELDSMIFLHPARGANVPDYADEDKSLYEIWWSFGWPYETSVAMQRLIFSGLFDRLPEIKILSHHLGAMAPYFEGRIGPGLDQFGSRTADEDYEGLLKRMKKRPLDYFKMFYADTATFGSRAATVCGLEFFDIDRVMFASDAPFDPEGGSMYIRETIKVLESLDLSKEDLTKIYQTNAQHLLGLELT